MKANEFVKKFGWDEVISQLNKTQDNVVVMWLGSQSNDYALVKDLKRLVESHELVAIHGFEKSKEIVANALSDDHFYSWALGDSGVRDKTVNIGELRKAIADVESCMEVTK